MEHIKEKKDRFPIFKERFRELQGEMSNTEFADFLGMSRQTVGFYLNGNRVPDIIGLEQIARKCNVSADWLIGLSNVKSFDGDVKSASNYLELSEDAVLSLKRISANNIMDYFGQIQDLEDHVYPANGMSDLFSSDAFFRAVLDISKAISFECIAKKAGEKKDNLTGEISVDNASDDTLRRRWMLSGKAALVGMAAVPGLPASDFYTDEAMRELRVAVKELAHKIASQY